MSDVKEKVAERLKETGPQVFEALVEHLTQETLDKRKAMAITAYAELQKAERELQKIKPDQQQYDVQGQLVGETYTKATIENRKKLLDKIDKINRAMEKAFENHDFSDLAKFSGDAYVGAAPASK